MTSPTELQDFRDPLGDGFADLLEDARVLEDAATVERFVCMAVLPLGGPAVPDELTEVLVAALEGLGAPAAPLLAGAELLGPPRLRDAAAAALERLRAAHGELRVPAGLGALRLCDAERLRSASADMYVLALTRPGDSRVQTAALVVEREETGGALVGGLLGDAQDEQETHKIREELGRAEVGLLERAPVKPSAVRKALLRAAERTRELDLAVDFELASWLPLVSLAVAGDAHAIGPVRAEPPDPGGLYVDSGDDAEFDRLSGEILDDFEQEVVARAPDGSALRLGGRFIADSMLNWKWSYGDGRLARWTAAEVEEFLLDYVPRKISLHDDEFDQPIVGAIAFMDFLADAGVLEGDTPETLARTTASLREEVAEALCDPSRWGSRSLDQRDDIFGRSLAAGKGDGSAPGGHQKRRERRRRARAARRRNRR